MASVRINVCLPEEIYQHLKEEVKPRETSRFITMAINKMIGEMRQERLAAEYREAAGEMRVQYKDLEGTVDDGID